MGPSLVDLSLPKDRAAEVAYYQRLIRLRQTYVLRTESSQEGIEASRLEQGNGTT